jgi:DNA-binding transcriptional ArsR family regulator
MSPKTKEAELDHRLLKALGHPLRQRILHLLTHRVASPSELAAELEEPLGNVSYHVKILAEYDAIELVRTEPVRGALEHFYRATMRSYFDDEDWAKLPVSVRRALTGDTLQDIWNEVASAADQQSLDDPTTHVSRTHLELDEQAYQELNDLLVSLLDRALELHAEAAPRIAELPPEKRETHRTALALLHFHRVIQPSTSRRPRSRRRRRDDKAPK